MRTQGRVLRLFSAQKDLHKIIIALSHSIGPVCNALLILLVIACVYAILATEFFGKENPEFFGRFQDSLFTMFQVAFFSLFFYFLLF